MYHFFGRITEIIVYSTLNFLPYLGPALYPFRNNLRYSRSRTVMLTALAVFLQIMLGLSAAFSPRPGKGILSALSTAVYFIFYFWAIKAHPGKILFTLLMLSNIADLTVVCSKCLEGQLFPTLALQQYRWSFSLVMAVVQLFIITPLFFYFRKYYADMIEKDTNISAWRYLWLIPATFYLLWFYHLYGNHAVTGLEIALQPAHTLFLMAINVGAFLIYHMITKLMNEYYKNISLEKQNHILTLETLQYKNLQDKITETRQARHDLRHHITVMTGLLNENKTEQLKIYLTNYKKSLPDDTPVTFCRNSTVNLLLQYFSRQAQRSRISFTAYADIPETLQIAEHDLAVILGNLLENALDACSMQKSGNRNIVFRGRLTNDSLILTVDNTFEGELISCENGSYLSTKHEEPGIGLASVRHITSRYQGMMRTETADGIFCVSVLLHISAPQEAIRPPE